jgi:protein-S-isoprenylcysteine O-methyltransferase Ste14
MVFLLSIILLISVIGIVAGIALFIYYDVNEKRIEVERNINKKIRTEEELMKIVLNVLERKWAYRVQFHFKIKEITVPKFEFEWNYLLNETISSLSQDVLDELKYYYKDDETTIKAVSELVQIYLYDYMERQRIK